MYISHDWTSDERLRVIKHLMAKIESSRDIAEIRNCAFLARCIATTSASACNMNREQIFRAIGQEDKARKEAAL